ncbi:MAG: IS1380 family transposase, partial [Acidobacteria bacterium]|nr:IS1380 family transposase [Acidobacteriota bacterium]
MGDKQNQPFQLSCNGRLKIDCRGSRVTSDGGLILVRELDERLGFGDLMAQHLTDSRR